MRSKSVNTSAVDTAMGRWVSMLCGHKLAGVKDVFRNGTPNCLVLVMICTGGRRRSVTCSELINRFASMQGIECCAVHLCQPTCRAHFAAPVSIAARCALAKEQDTNLSNIVELSSTTCAMMINSAQTTYLWRMLLPHARSSHVPSKSGRSKSDWQKLQQEKQGGARLTLVQQLPAQQQRDLTRGQDLVTRSPPCLLLRMSQRRRRAAMRSLRRKCRGSMTWSLIRSMTSPWQGA